MSRTTTTTNTTYRARLRSGTALGATGPVPRSLPGTYGDNPVEDSPFASVASGVPTASGGGTQSLENLPEGVSNAASSGRAAAGEAETANNAGVVSVDTGGNTNDAGAESEGSSDSADIPETPVRKGGSRPPLTSEQIRAIEIAQSGLSRAQRDQIEKRRERVNNLGARSRDPSPGPSKDKGKGVDVRNWGDVVRTTADERELDPEVQKVLLDQAIGNVLEAERAAGIVHPYETEDDNEQITNPNTKETSSKDKGKKDVSESKKRKNKERREKSREKSRSRKKKAATPLSTSMGDLIDKVTKNVDRGSDDDGPSDSDDSSDDNLNPAGKIDPKSTLGATFKKLDKLEREESKKAKKKSVNKSKKKGKKSKKDKKRRGRSRNRKNRSRNNDDDDEPSDSSDSSDSSSEESDGDREASGDDSESSSSNDDSTSESDDEDGGRRRRKARNVKSVTPPDYKGQQNVPHFQRYMTLATNRVEDLGRRLPSNRRVGYVAQYLKGRAWDWYHREIAYREERMTLSEFFRRLYNWVFPATWKQEQRDRLDAIKQGGQTTREFYGRFRELCDTVGLTHKGEMVQRFFRALRPEFREAVFTRRLDPDTISMRKLIKECEYVELARSVRQYHTHQNGQDGGKRRRDADGNRRDRGERRDKRQRQDQSRDRREDRKSKKTNATPGFNSNQTKFKRDGERKEKRKVLTEEKKAKLRKENRCFHCEETGHMASRCPKRNAVASSSRGPPGISNSNIEIELDMAHEDDGTTSGSEGDDEVSNLSLHLNSAVLTDETLPSSTISPTTNENRRSERTDLAKGAEELDRVLECLDDDELIDLPWKTRVPGWEDEHTERQALVPMGDPLLRKAEVLLKAGAPYPGDPASWETYDGGRFYVYRTNKGKSYAIMDQLRDCEDLIDWDVLRDPEFNLANWYSNRLNGTNLDEFEAPRQALGDVVGQYLIDVLERNGPYPFDHVWDPDYQPVLRGERRFRFEFEDGIWDVEDGGYWVFDKELGFKTFIPLKDVRSPSNRIVKQYVSRLFDAQQRFFNFFAINPLEEGILSLLDRTPDEEEADAINRLREAEEEVLWNHRIRLDYSDGYEHVIELFGKQVEAGTYPAIQRNSSHRKELGRSVPKPVVVQALVNGKPVRALIDTGSLGDFMSTTLAEQLKVKRRELECPVNVQLAVSGSRTKVNYDTLCRFKYQEIDEERRFDIINLSNYDLILGTPFLFQHQVLIGFNPFRVVVGTNESLPMEGESVRKLAVSHLSPELTDFERIRAELLEYARPICKSAAETPLPPLRKINHRIPLIDADKSYPRRRSRCPEALKAQWDAKRVAYIKTGRWVPTTSYNTVPMLFITKPGKNGDPPRLRTVVDLRERNANTKKMNCPLPDMDGILRRISRAKYRTIIDGQDAYEQIRIEESDVPNSAMMTPEGAVLSQVMQQGDCNAVSTFQTIMTDLFSEHIGKFVEVYLDDIIIFSDTLEEHVRHFKMVIDLLKKESFYLSERKINILPEEMKVLGRVVDRDGIRMDPEKVDALAKWKTPTNRARNNRPYDDGPSNRGGRGRPIFRGGARGGPSLGRNGTFRHIWRRREQLDSGASSDYTLPAYRTDESSAYTSPRSANAYSNLPVVPPAVRSTTTSDPRVTENDDSSRSYPLEALYGVREGYGWIQNSRASTEGHSHSHRRGVRQCTEKKEKS